MATQKSEPRAVGAAPAYTMYLDQSAHLDWDWLQTFEENFYAYPFPGPPLKDGVDKILSKAIANLESDTSYHYTICEIGYLRRYVEEHASEGIIGTLRGFGDRFQALSGGITSPDNLVCAGEGFIRNYLVGQHWLATTLGMQAKPHCWIPDDFGQSPELPALLAALGFASVSFMRAPGGQQGAFAADRTKHGLDFVWQASDSSAIYAHWLTVWYNQGNALWDGQRHPDATNGFIDAYGTRSEPGGQYSGARTPYMYVPIDDDFSMPIEGIAQDIADWNSDSPDVHPGGMKASGVQLVQGTFDQFMTGVISADEQQGGVLDRLSYNGTPYWTGYYASRPELKILHYQCVRELCAAETFGLLAERAGGTLPATFWDDIDTAWANFAPSTHHDYVCGTAVDPVYQGEQIPLLKKATTSAAAPAGAVALSATALAALGAVTGPAGGVVIGNPLSFDRYDVATLDGPPGGASFLVGSNHFPVQATADGKTLLFAHAPSLGAEGGAWSDQPSDVGPPPPTLTVDANGNFALANEYLTATIAPNGMLLSLKYPVGEGTGEMLAPPGPDTDLGFYHDSGGLYRFGNEDGGTLQRQTVPLVPLGTAVTENGPLRAGLSVQVQATVQNETYDYTRDYRLMSNEPFLRVTLTGRAPSFYSVMATVPLNTAPTAIDHGTAGHWTSVQPANDPNSGQPFWGGPVFRATHDFVLPAVGPADDRTYLGAVYHGAIPAWAIDDSGYLIGCLLRNTPKNELGAGGTDSDPHTQTYAIRVPVGLGPPASGQPLQEARAFASPLKAAPSSAPTSQSTHLSLATFAAAGPAMITVAKPGQYDPTSLILRLQQPTNAPLTVTIFPPEQPMAARLLNAAERPWQGGGSAQPASSGRLVVEMVGALATVELPGLGRRLPPGD